jgi:hypothetical protein
VPPTVARREHEQLSLALRERLDHPPSA